MATRGLTTPGLFACTVNKRQLLALKEAYDAGRRALRSARVASNLEPATAANLLLLWLGALPEPPFPSEHVPAVLELYAKPHTSREERVATMRCLLKRTEPFIVEALFPLFELLHHYWINQPQREDTLSDLASTFAAPVFGTPAEHGTPPQTAGLLAEATALLIAEYRPLFTQPYNLQRYAADLARQQCAAEAKEARARASAEATATSTAASPPSACAIATGTTSHRLSPFCINTNIYNPLHDTNVSGSASSSSSSHFEVGSPLLTPRRLGTLSVMRPAEPLLGCSPEETNPIWAALHSSNGSACGSEEDDDMMTLLDGMLTSTISAVFAPTHTTTAMQACSNGKDMALDRKHSPVSVVAVMHDDDDMFMMNMSTDTESLTPGDVSRDGSDSDGEMPMMSMASLMSGGGGGGGSGAQDCMQPPRSSATAVCS